MGIFTDFKYILVIALCAVLGFVVLNSTGHWECFAQGARTCM